MVFWTEISIEDTQKKLDKALKRNLVGSQQSAITTTPKTTATELPTEEPISETDEADPIEE